MEFRAGQNGNRSIEAIEAKDKNRWLFAEWRKRKKVMKRKNILHFSRQSLIWQGIGIKGERK